MDESNTVDKNVDRNGKNMGIISRPDASPGYWLCCLLPAAFIATLARQTGCQADEELTYRTLTIVALGTMMQSMNFFICLAIGAGRYSKMFFALSPGMVTFLMLQYWTGHTYGTCLGLGFSATLGYQYAYVRVVRGFPKSCTLGEACILMQGVVLFVVNAVFKLPVYYKSPPTDEFKEMGAVMMEALLCLLVISWLLASLKIFRSIVLFYPTMMVLVVAVCIIPITKDLPIIAVIRFVFSDIRRVYIVIFYMMMTVATAFAVRWQLGTSEKASTRVRKIFHVLIVLVYLPGLVYECTFLYLATGVALAVFSVLDIIRMLKIPPFAKVLEDAFATLHDEKDAGNVALTPFCLLIGCSLPLWISQCPCLEGDSASGKNLLPTLAGILSVGIGDMAASVIGSKFGKHKWGDSNRSIEGSLAYVASQLVVLAPLFFFKLTPTDGYSVFATAAAVVLTAVTEAFTDQIDNLVLPLIFYIVVSTS